MENTFLDETSPLSLIVPDSVSSVMGGMASCRVYSALVRTQWVRVEQSRKKVDESVKLMSEISSGNKVMSL